LAAVAAVAIGIAPARSADPKGEGWVNLFNGKDLDGWVQRGGKAKYRAEDGMIVGTPVTGDKLNSFLCTKKNYSDFALDLEFKVHADLNSGVQVRSECFDEPKTMEVDQIDANGVKQRKKITIAAGRVHGYQVEIDPDVKKNRMWTGGIYDEGRRLWLVNLKDNEPARKAFKPDEWNAFHIECKGDSIKTWLNGVQAADLKDSMTPTGFIGLQVHQIGSKAPDALEVRFRNIRLKELK
jgi:hypothetical protein